MQADFAPFEAKMQQAGLPAEAIRAFRHYYEQLRSGTTGLIASDEIDPVGEVADAETLPDSRGAGREALAQAVVIKLNGGLGTSMGMTRAKSLLPVKQGLAFLDIIVRQVLQLRSEFDCRLPLVLMNSFRTRDDSLQLLGRYPELESDLPRDFLQHKVPRIQADNFSPVEWPKDPAAEWCPPGHGDLYTALVTSGLLEDMLERGYRYAFLSNADNLGAVLDPGILGWFAQEQIPFLMEVAERTEADKKGGHLARLKDGRLVLRETAQCPDDDQDSFQDVSRFRYFNTNNLWVRLDALQRVLEERDSVLGLPMICNHKTVDPKDASSPRVIQLETAMGAAVSTFDAARALRVSRTRFAPVKTSNDLLALWSDLYVLTERYEVIPSAARTARDLVIDLDSKYYRSIDDLQARFPAGAPSLVDCQRLSVRGDVRFGAGVVCRGEVVIENDAEEQRVIPDGAKFPNA